MSLVLIRSIELLLTDFPDIMRLNELISTLLRLREDNFEETSSILTQLDYVSGGRTLSLIRMVVLISSSRFKCVKPYLDIYRRLLISNHILIISYLQRSTKSNENSLRCL